MHNFTENYLFFWHHCIKAQCTKIVTLGIGSLRERVIHNETGFIAKNEEEFAKYTLDLFNDNDLCIQLKKNLYKIRNSNNWINSANSFLKVLEK